MICPNCKYDKVENTNFCHNCGIDAVLFTETCKISDTMYNSGLKQAKADDLTGAIISLVKSIEFNKNNWYARNLLGLIYFEIGHVGDALKHWVISSSMYKDENPAVKYLDVLQNNSRALEVLNDSVKNYNQALEYLSQESDDIAIIQLKKAIEINPKFVDAMNLLTACYLMQDDREKAQALIERVIAIDVNNVCSLRYYRYMYPNKARPESIVKIKKHMGTPSLLNTPTYTPLHANDKKSFGESFHLAEILSFLVGGACVFALMYILVIPDMIDKKDQEISDLSASLTSSQEEHQKTILETQEETSRLEDENLALKQENDAWDSLAKQQGNIEKLDSAYDLYFNEGDVVAAADILYTIEADGVPADQEERANELRAEVYPEAAKYYYETALSLYNDGDNAEAKSMFEECLIFVADDANYINDVIYHLGLIAEAEGNIDQAKEYYERVITDYPGTNIANKAQESLDNLSA